MGTISFHWRGYDWRLGPDRAVYWPKAGTLIVADPHFGKAQHFRGAGIPVPTGTTRSNLDRLDAALQQTRADRLVVLGDFFHSRLGVTPNLVDQLAAWRERWASLTILNVRGNHDRQAGDPPQDLAIECVPTASRDAFDPAIAFAHEPIALPDAATFCGHVHPGVRLVGRGRRRLRAACFHFTDSVATLPAFGAFTGLGIIRPKRGDRVFAVGPDAVIDVSARGQTEAASFGQ